MKTRKLLIAGLLGAACLAQAGDLIVNIDYLDEPFVAAHSNGMTRASIRELAAKYRKAGAKAITWRVACVGVGTYRTKRLSTMKWARETPHPEITKRMADKSKLPPDHRQEWWPDSIVVPFQKTLDAFDPLEVAAEAFHAEGLEFWMFVDLFDEKLSRFLEEHPECLVHTKDGAKYPGLRDYGNETAVREKLADIAELYRYKPDAIYLCTSCHARHLYFPEPDGAFGTLPAEKMTDFLRKLRAQSRPHGVKIVMGMSLGPKMDFCTPYWSSHARYSIEQDWRTWIDEGLVDGLNLADYENVFGESELWKGKGLDCVKPGHMPLDILAPPIRAYAKGRVKLYFFGTWLGSNWIEHTHVCARMVNRYGLDGFFAHESCAIENAVNGFEKLAESVRIMNGHKTTERDARKSPWRACVVDDGGKYFRETVMAPAKAPVAFTYGGERHVGLGGGRVLERKIETKGVETTGRLRVAVDANLVAELAGAYRADFGETEWVLWFENPGKAPSKVLEDVVSMSYRFAEPSAAEKCPRLRGIRGDFKNQYSAYDMIPWQESDRYTVVGRSHPTHVEFPYFNLYVPDGGVLCALGWAGNWQSDFVVGPLDRPRAEWQFRTEFRACPSFKSVLLPGERIRHATIVLIPHKGSDPDHVSNLWRAWFRTYNEPKWNAAGDPMKPFSSTCFAGDTGRPNFDGSVSEGHDTWKRTFDKIVSEKVVPDFRQIDAGWYFDPRGKTIPADWFDVGNLALDTVKWPGTTFRDSIDAGHAVGMKAFVWFEPERVNDPAALAKSCGYRPEWAIPYGRNIWMGDKTGAWNNIGDPECFKWTLGRILGMMDANHVDFFREDHNVEPGPAWVEGDRRAEAKLKLARRGMTETKGVMGHWALWDAVVEHGRRLNKCTFVDSSAAGGGRNDLESLRRAIPLSRSDSDRTRMSLRLSMTSSLCRWIPFHGSSTKEGLNTPNGIAGEDGPGASPYVFRASFLPICNVSGCKFAHNPDLDYNLLRRNLAEWRSVSEFLLKDFYVLTAWRPGDDAGAWTVFAYDDAEKGESILLAFRQEEAPYPQFEARLKFADPKRTYEITDADTGRSTRHAGADLKEKGLIIELPERKSCALYRIRVCDKSPQP